MLSKIIFISLFVVSWTQNTNNCTGQVNNHPLVTQTPVFVNSTSNGKLYYIDGNGIIEPRLNIIHLYGSAYDMGYAYGELMYNEIRNLSNLTMEWIFDNINEYLSVLSPQEQEKIDQDSVYGFLDDVYDRTQNYIPNRYIELMTGISDATNLPYMDVARCAMIPEAIKAKCSMVGAWGEAVSKNVSLVQLRALDNGEESPFPLYPTLVIYHPSESNSFTFASLNYAGFVGSFTGWNNAQVGLCEKYWGTGACECENNNHGEPWTLVLQDVLQFASNKDNGINIMKNSKRTCPIFVGLGDNISNEFNIIEYSYQNITVFNDENFPSYNNHPLMKNVLYIDKFDQPSYDPCLADLLQSNYGNINAEYLYRNVSPMLQTGSLHVAVYDYLNQFIYLSNAGVYNPGQPQQMGYDRPFIQIDMKSLFNEPAPN